MSVIYQAASAATRAIKIVESPPKKWRALQGSEPLAPSDDEGRRFPTDGRAWPAHGM
jgi:hypothetical protein